MTRFFIAILLFFSIGLQAQDCHLGELQIQIQDCNNQGEFYVVLNFTHENTGNDGFKVTGNGNDYGIFQYANLPITLGPFVGNGTSVYELHVQDVQKVNCTSTKTFGPVQCPSNQCHIYDLVVDPLECTSDSTFAVFINFFHDNTGTAGFDLYYNNSFWANYAYSSLPFTITNLPESGNNSNTIKVVDAQNADCSKTIEFEGLHCGGNGGDCHLGDMTADISPCDTNGKFYVTINFTYQNTGNNGFKVQGNGTNYGNFNYADLPITIGPLMSNQSKNWEFVAIDNDHELCRTEAQLGVIDCNDICEIFEWTITKLECTSDSTYAIKLNFQYNDYPDTLFWVYGNSKFLGAYKLNKLPVTILNFPEGGSNIDTITVCAPDTIPNCCHSKTFEGLHCPASNCHIAELNVTNIACTSDSTYSATVFFIPQNTSGAGFDLWINNHYFGTYPYASIPLTLTDIPSNGPAGDLIKVCDHEFQDCCTSKEFQGLTCSGDCHLYDMTVTTVECTSDSTYRVIVDFQHQFTVGQGFDLYANGNFFAYYLYSQLPITINNFPASGNNYDHIKVYDHEQESCNLSKEFPALHCNGNCELYDLTVIVGDCNPNGTYHLTINFKQQNPASDKFDLYAGNTFLGTYLYSQLPLTINNFPKSGNNNDVVKVCDHEAADCCRAKEFDSPDCSNGDCHLYDLVVTTVECTSNTTYKVIVNFQHQNTMSDHFDLFANGVYFGNYAYSQLPLTINNFPASGNNNDVIKVSDNDNAPCFAIKEFPALHCNGNCELYDLTAVVGDCNSNDTYHLTINFKQQNPGSDKFDLFANNVYFGTYLYSQLPLTINNFPKSGNNNDVVKVCDHEKADCCRSKEFASPNCSSGDCHLYDLVVTTVECTSSSTYKVIVNFQHQYTMSDHFDLFANGVYFGYYAYSQLPLTINNFPASGNNNDVIKVVDNDNAPCYAIKEFPALNCSTQDCSIYDLVVDLGGCTSDSTYEILINFNVQNPGSTKFDLYANGTFFGTYNYSDLPLTLGNFPDSGNNNDHVKVCDHELAECCKSIEFSSPNCANGAPDIYDIHAEVFNCIGNKFNVKLEFNFKNPGNQGYRVQGNGIDYGSFEYTQVPLDLIGLNADNLTEYEFAVIDNQFPAANDYMLLGRVKCTTSLFDPTSDEKPFIYYFNGDDLIVKGKEEIQFTGLNAFDIMGRNLYTDSNTSNQYVINTASWVPGNYILFVHSKFGRSSVLVAKSK